MTPLSIDYLQSNQKLFPIKKAPIKKGSGSSIIIYGFNPSTNEFKSLPSKVSCSENITGQRYSNVNTINKRIDKGILYNGFYLQTKPFK